MPYTPTIWIDHQEDPVTGEVYIQGTEVNALNLNKIEQGVVQAMEKAEQAEPALTGASTISSIVDGDALAAITEEGTRRITWASLRATLKVITDAAYAAETHTHTASQVGADPTGSAAAVQTALNGHVGNRSNPHGVTAAQIGTYTKVESDSLLAGKSPTGHSHTPASIGAATAAQGTKADGALQRSGGSMTGALTASNPSVGTSAVRNIYAGTSDLTAGSSSLTTGSLYFVYV